MKTMAISDFKAHALQVLGHIAKTKEPVVVTKRGAPVAEVLPFRPLDGKLFDDIELTCREIRRIFDTWIPSEQNSW